MVKKKKLFHLFTEIVFILMDLTRFQVHSPIDYYSCRKQTLKQSTMIAALFDDKNVCKAAADIISTGE